MARALRAYNTYVIRRADATGRGSSAKDFIGSHGDEAIVTLSIVQVRLVFFLAFLCMSTCIPPNYVVS